LFDEYQAAFDALDVARVVDLFDEPCAIVDLDRTVVFRDRQSLSDGVSTLVSFYRSVGFVSALAARIDVQHLCDEAAQVDVTWKMRLRTGDATFSTRYWLAQRHQVPRISSVLAYSEGRAWSGLRELTA
jgi:hypothetical protein